MAAPEPAILPRDPLEPLRSSRGTHTDGPSTTACFDHVWRGAGKGWWALFGCALSRRSACCSSRSPYTLYKGIGVWGNNIPVGWAFDIINFVWWIGIGHAGTLISAILLLFQQKWRTSINRFAEAMTLFAVICALLFPLLHTGRPWFAAYWLFPYPSVHAHLAAVQEPADVGRLRGLDVLHDLAAVLVPRPGSRPGGAARLVQEPDQRASSTASSPWAGAARARHWAEYKWAYLLLAGLSTPLVLSVHTIVSFDFAVSVLPGWHTTIFPPYFVAGAVFSASRWS